MKIVSLADLSEESVSHHPAIKKRVIFSRGDAPHLTHFSRARVEPGQTVGAHRHTGMHEVFFVLAGSGEIMVDGAAHALEENRAVLIAPGEAHEITNTGTGDLWLLYFGVEE